MIRLLLASSLIACGAAVVTARAAPPAQVIVIELRDHRFGPDTIIVPAGQRIKIDITNRDATADDFDSDDLHVDKELGPHGRASFFIGPLKPSSYPFKGELHAATAQGKIVAVAPAQ